jgi:AraC-like DNA-binding protein
MKFMIRNMVCNRCILAVRSVFEKRGVVPTEVQMGEVAVAGDVEAATLKQIDGDLLALGFERIHDRNTRLIGKVKQLVIGKIHHSPSLDLDMKWSDFISAELHHDYGQISTLFSSVEGVTLEQYIIRQKIEKVKELLFYDELTLSEIADRLGYSSVQHLSTQFKKVIGATPTQFRKQHSARSRRSLDSI